MWSDGPVVSSIPSHLHSKRLFIQLQAAIASGFPLRLSSALDIHDLVLHLNIVWELLHVMDTALSHRLTMDVYKGCVGRQIEEWKARYDNYLASTNQAIIRYC
jgi:hypothetical protein